jgi:hypothetical protein
VHLAQQCRENVRLPPIDTVDDATVALGDETRKETLERRRTRQTTPQSKESKWRVTGRHLTSFPSMHGTPLQLKTVRHDNGQ